MKRLLPCILIILIAITAASCGSNTQKTEDDDRGYIVKVGQKAPDFSATLIDGSTFKLSENRGKVVLLQFTASWCRVCRMKMPHIENEIWLPLKDKNLVVVGIDRDEPLETVIEFAKTMEITYPLALDPGSDIFALYAHRIAGVTRNVVVDKKGKIAFLTRLYNEDEFNEMIEVIKNLMEI